jgi:hypothetical protein
MVPEARLFSRLIDSPYSLQAMEVDCADPWAFQSIESILVEGHKVR